MFDNDVKSKTNIQNAMKILFTTPEIKHPPVGGPYLRIQNSIKALNKVSELHVLARFSKESMGGDRAEKFYKHHCRRFSYSPSFSEEDKTSFSYMIRGIFQGENTSGKKCESDFIIDYAKKHRINIIWFGFGNISYDLMKQIKTKAPQLKLVCDTDSVWSRFILRGLPYARTEEERLRIETDGKQKEVEEADWVKFCDVTTAVSEVDAEYYRSLYQGTNRIKIFSNVIDLANYQQKQPPPDNFKKPNIFFAGYFGPNSPTDIAARWVINDILPIIQKSIPDIHFYVLGRASDTTLADINHPNVTITGQLDSVLPYLQNADVALVPLKFESGTRFKILEAAACGVPLVSTTLGAEGIPIRNEENILIADDTQGFAEAVVRIMSDKGLSDKISNNCKMLIDANYGLHKHEEEALSIIEFLNRK
jgi:polysaccharide biosynthesis protein PslH